MPPRELADDVARGNKSAVSRALNLVEDRRAASRAEVGELLAAIATTPRTAGGQRIGLTGPPGVGKSTLAAALARTLRARGHTVGVVAVDPSSVRSGGSLLGDRARMAFDAKDEGVFVRSLATGGEAGGLAYAANAAVRVLGAAYDRVLIETTGVGQTETDVVHVADTVVLVVQPGSGDILQFLKAGIMEIPDVLVVNKADHEELARRAVTDLRGALHAAHGAGIETTHGGWEIPLLATSALHVTGIDALADALEAHRAHVAPGLADRRRRGEIEWALSMLQRLHGEHGLATLGGRDAVRLRIDASIEAGATALETCTTIGAAYLQIVRTGNREK